MFSEWDTFDAVFPCYAWIKGCVAWALLSKSADWVGCYAKYVIFKDTSWTEILHVVEEFHSTFLHGRTISARLVKKNGWVCLICIEECPSLMKIKVVFISKSYFGKYYEATATRKKIKNLKKKFPKIAVKRCFFCLLLSF